LSFSQTTVTFYVFHLNSFFGKSTRKLLSSYHAVLIWNIHVIAICILKICFWVLSWRFHNVRRLKLKNRSAIQRLKKWLNTPEKKCEEEYEKDEKAIIGNSEDLAVITWFISYSLLDLCIEIFKCSWIHVIFYSMKHS